MIMVLAVSWLLTGCSAVNSAQENRRYTNPGLGMAPTIRNGQEFDARPVEPGEYAPKRGDVVVFTMPGWTGRSDALYVKRVVAVANDTVRYCTPDGKVMLNGAPLAEPYLAPNTPQLPFKAVTVPSGRLWVMGDNRGSSQDSRAFVGDVERGTIPAAAVTAVAVLK
jgi:signal peptidase I